MTPQKSSQVLDWVLDEKIPSHINLTEPVMTAARQTRRQDGRPRMKLASSLLIALAALLVLSSVAYAVYRLMIDHGLETADQNGLVNDFNQTAMPTVFAAVPTQLAAKPLASTSQNGITVTLDWAYMDEYRLAWQLTISGLSIPNVANLDDFVCNPNLTDDQGVRLNNLYLTVPTEGAQINNSYQVVYVAYQHVDASQVDHLDLHLDLTVGPCGPWWNYDQVYTGPGPTPTPVPLIGNYHLSFSVPVNPGVTLTPNQTVEASGIKIRLKAITFTPSYTVAELCFQKPLPPNLTDAAEWYPQDIQLLIDQSKSIQADGMYPNNKTTNNANEICSEVGFSEVVSPSSKITLIVSNLSTTESLSKLLESASLQLDVKTALAREGIVIEFPYTSTSSDRYWEIVKKPAGMTDSEVDAKVYALLRHTLEGVWKFNVNSKP